MVDSEETLGQRIRKLRRERGMTLQQVAGEDFSRAFLHQVETGRSQPSTRVLRMIADRLGAPIDYLVDGSIRLLLRERADRDRLRRLRELRGGARTTVDAAAHERLADRALREGSRELALEHYRAARILRDGEEVSLAPRGGG